MSTWRDIYDLVYSKYKSKITDPHTLKMKITAVTANMSRSDRSKIGSTIFGILWLSLDKLVRNKPERVWSYEENTIVINLTDLFPFNRGMIDLFLDMYVEGDLENFY